MSPFRSLEYAGGCNISGKYMNPCDNLEQIVSAIFLSNYAFEVNK
jgi:hypothetical protein